jgi:hypothetical protein
MIPNRVLFSLILLLALGAIDGWAHELTLRAYEASLAGAVGKLGAVANDERAPSPDTFAGAEMCQLTVRLLNADTGQPIQGLIRLKHTDGRNVPLAGLVNRGIGLRQSHPAKNWHAADADTVISVPRAALTIEAFSGLDTELTREVVDLSTKPTHRLELKLKPFFNAAQRGWFGGNTHLHLNNLTRAQADEYLRVIPRADGLDVLFVSRLERAEADRNYISNEYTLADLNGFSGSGLFFGNGQEHRHNFEGNREGYGHVMFLNIRQMVQPVSIGPTITGAGPDWPPLRRGIAQARREGATVIWCHNSFGHEDVPDWLAGLLDAHNIFDGGSQGSYEDTFYRYLNIGLRVPFSTGTDWFMYDFSRVYARLTTALTVQNWLAALAAGRTFISNGPLLELRVGQSEVGDTIQLSQPGKLPVLARAQGRHDFNRLELIQNGKVVQAAPSRPVDGHFEAELNGNLEIDGPSWVAVRVAGGSLDSDGAVVLPPGLPARGSGSSRNEMGEALFAHTSPVYIEFGGRRVFRPEAAQALIADMEAALQQIPAKGKFASDTQREDVLKIYRDGIRSLRKRLNE